MPKIEPTNLSLKRPSLRQKLPKRLKRMPRWKLNFRRKNLRRQMKTRKSKLKKKRSKRKKSLRLTKSQNLS